MKIFFPITMEILRIFFILLNFYLQHYVIAYFVCEIDIVLLLML